ncbi:DNA ligase [Paenibacillus dendritiformis]
MKTLEWIMLLDMLFYSFRNGIIYCLHQFISSSIITLGDDMFISPMLLQYANNNLPFDKPNHIAELKLDGIRLIASNMNNLKLYTRHNNDVTHKFPELLNNEIPKGTILDGEVIITDENGKPDFEAMMSRFQSRFKNQAVTFCAFDIICHNGIDVTKLPLYKRKELLQKVLRDSERVVKVQSIEGSAKAYFEVIKKYGLEGIVIKDLNSKYFPDTRSWSWQKAINWTYVDVYISGYRKDKFGWLTSILSPDGKMIPTGIVEYGVNTENKKEFRRLTHKTKMGEDKNFVYIEPIVRAQVKTRNWTKSGKLRTPVFVKFL